MHEMNEGILRDGYHMQSDAQTNHSQPKSKGYSAVDMIHAHIAHINFFLSL